MDHSIIQRVRSHGAAIDRHASEIADRFLDGFFSRCRHLRTPAGRFRGTAERQHRCIAQQWAWFVRHLGELNHVTPELEALGSYLRARGLGLNDFRMARGACWSRCDDVSGESWTGQIESDWATAFDECLRLMSPAATIPMPGSEGYAVAA